MNRLFPRICLCGSLIISFLFLPINNVYADGTSAYNDNTYWQYWYVEQQSGVSFDDVQPTDYGISVGEYVNAHGYSVSDAIDTVTEQANNAANATADGLQYYWDAVQDVYSHSVDAAEVGYYKAEDALRKTVDTAGHAVYNVSSSDFWNGFYNSMYNGGGYNDIYVDQTEDGYTVNVNGTSYNVSYAGIGYISGDIIDGTTDVYSTFTDGGSNGRICFRVGDGYIAGRTTWYGMSGSPPNGFTVTYDYYTNTLTCHYQWLKSDNSGFWTEEAYAHFTNNISSGEQSSTPVLQPSQMGFIIDPLTGDRIPVYTDPSQNPFTPNSDGTVDYNGDTLPIYVDPIDISDDGWLWILKYLNDRDKTDPTQNPFGQPWNTQPDGTTQGGFFSNLVKDISSLFSGLGNLLKNVFDNLVKKFTDFVGIIVDGLKKFIEDFIDFDTSIFDDIDIDNNFGVITELYHTLLEILGVE